jgi:phospholipid/cholesterol/gamma-HCH transport system permease protein
MKLLQPIGEFGYLIHSVVRQLPHAFRDWRRVAYQLDHVGVNSIPLVLLTGFFAGCIIAWQSALQFTGLVSMNVLGGQVTRVVVMEMAPVLTALVISGRIGASMTAEIGTMKVTEQIDALRTMGIDPVRYIVMPRFLGLTIMMPVLAVFSILTGVFGAYLVSAWFLDVTPAVFFDSIKTWFQPGDLIGGLLKSMVFGMLISLIGCFMGMSTQGGSRGVGNSTIQSFVFAAILILIWDFLLGMVVF